MKQLATPSSKLLLTVTMKLLQNVKTQLFFFLTYGQHFLICEAKQDIFLVKLLFRKLPSKTNCQPEVLHYTRWNTYFPSIYLL